MTTTSIVDEPAPEIVELPEQAEQVDAEAPVVDETPQPEISDASQSDEQPEAPPVVPEAADPIVVPAPGGEAVPDEVEAALAAVRLDPLADVADDIDADVLPIFLDEAAELFPLAGEEVRAWRADPGSGHVVGQLRRTLHTFKGSARMAGAMRLGQLVHLMESRLLDDDSQLQVSTALFDLLDEDLDHIAFVLDHLRRNEFNVPLPWVARTADETPTADDALSAAEAGAQPLDQPATASDEDRDAPLRGTTEMPAAPFMPAAPMVERPIVVPMQRVAPPPAEPLHAAAVRVEAVHELETGARAQLRVRADMIDRLVNEAGEVAIARARVEGELRALKANLLELTNNVIRLRTQMREIEIQAESQIQSSQQLQEQHGDFDPLEFDRYTRFQELTRSLAEGINDVSTVQQSLLKNLDDADAALVAQARLSRDVQQRLFSIRTVPFGSLSQRLYRILRATARELDKRANLEIHGGQVELDRSVLEKLVGPLEHLLRNALDHGVETPDVRRRTGQVGDRRNRADGAAGRQ